ncbi:MAG TPA: RidA family protein [Solirubrobacteraceae bacterium]
MAINRVATATPATYSDSVTATGAGQWVYVSGQLPVGPDGEIAGGGLRAQVSACLDNVEASLARAGVSLQDVVRITAYLTDLTDYGEYAAVRGERFAGALPASAAVGVASLLAGALIEVDAVAFISAEGSEE